MNLYKKILLLSFLFLLKNVWSIGTETFKYPFYIGALIGYGTTTWQGLVPNSEDQNLAISISTPIKVNEGGAAWGIFGGYEVTPFFALEALYMKYPRAEVFFDPISLFSFNNNDKIMFTTLTETVSLFGKVMLVVPNSKVRVYSSLGAADIHRSDILLSQWHLSPTFAAGFNYHFTDHVVGEFGGVYVAGFGESKLNPANSFFPFLYSLDFRLAYYF